MFKFLVRHFLNTMKSERGGGGSGGYEAAPTTPATSASEPAADIYKSRLQYDPQIAALEYAMAQQYAPQYGQLFSKTAEQQFPGIGQLQQTGMQSALERLQNPFGYTPDETAALEAIRQRQREQLTKSLRERANLGGGLYGGRAAGTEQRSLTELEQAFAAEDINRQLQGGLYAQQQAIPYLQLLYPQIQQTPAVTQSAVPSADTLYNALYASSQPNYTYQQATPSPMWGLAGQGLQAGASLGGAAMMAAAI